MHRRLTDLDIRVITTFFTVIGLATVPAGLAGTPLPLVVAVFVFAMGFVALLYLSARSSGHPWPVISHVLVVLLLASTAGFATAWISGRPGRSERIEFVVVPYDLVALESVAPGPDRESQAAAPHPYGDHVYVRCYVKGVDDRRWYQLDNGNFLSARDVAPLLFSTEKPPAC